MSVDQVRQRAEFFISSHWIKVESLFTTSTSPLKEVSSVLRELITFSEIRAILNIICYSFLLPQNKGSLTS
jgi:hypothetical protein